MKIGDRIYLALHNGLFGSAMVSGLKAGGLIHLFYRNSGNPNVTNQSSVQYNFGEKKSAFVFPAAAAKAGSIVNGYPAAFPNDSQVFAFKVIYAAHNNSVKKFHFTGRSPNK